MNNNSIVFQNQQPRINEYLENPNAAWITDVATIEGANLEDPFHTQVIVNEELQIPFPVGVHRAVGGLHDAPNPGDILCASLAACFESTMRMVANRLGVKLTETRVRASAEVDVRGTLMIDMQVPVGFQKMTLDLELRVADETKERMIKTLVKATKYCCIIYQTISKGIPIAVNTRILNVETA